MFKEYIKRDAHNKSLYKEEIKVKGLYNLYLIALGAIKLKIKKNNNHHK